MHVLMVLGMWRPSTTAHTTTLHYWMLRYMVSSCMREREEKSTLNTFVQCVKRQNELHLGRYQHTPLSRTKWKPVVKLWMLRVTEDQYYLHIDCQILHATANHSQLAAHVLTIIALTISLSLFRNAWMALERLTPACCITSSMSFESRSDSSNCNTEQENNTCILLHTRPKCYLVSPLAPTFTSKGKAGPGRETNFTLDPSVI